jgi:hypothetical protein
MHINVSLQMPNVKKHVCRDNLRFLQNISIYIQVHTALQPRSTLSKCVSWYSNIVIKNVNTQMIISVVSVIEL